MSFYIPQLTTTNRESFITYWAAIYYDRNENLYEANIGMDLDTESILQLYIWKNGGTLSVDKMDSVENNYIPRINDQIPVTIQEGVEYFADLQGGRIWNIFWLHCKNPQLFPIFDQHAYRAFKYCIAQQIHELTDLGDGNFRNEYFNNYINFFSNLKDNNNRRIDKALFAFGKFLKKNSFVIATPQ